MKRLTERDEYGNADIAELSDAMQEIYGCLSFDETNVLTTVLNRLAAYEDTGLMPDDVEPTGIIIDHWEMPESCDKCPLLDWDLGSIKCKITERHFDVDKEPFRERKVDDCPLVVASDSKVKIDKEVSHGRWIHEKIDCSSSKTYCSECGEPAPFICVADDHYGNQMHGETRKTRFCPNCGASMRENEE